MKFFVSLLLLLTFSYPELLRAAVACGTVTSSVTEADPHTLSVTPDAGSNRVQIVHTSMRLEGGTVSGVTSSAGGTWGNFGTASNTTPNPDITSAVYYSTDFVDGAQTLSVDLSAEASQSTVVSYTCTGINTTTPWRSSAATNTGAGTSISVTEDSATGDLVLDFATVASLDSGEPTIGADQSSLYSISNEGQNMDTMGSSEAGAASNTMSWSAATSEQWAIVAGSLQPAVTATIKRKGITFQ